MSLLLTQVGAPPAVQVYAIPKTVGWFDFTPDPPKGSFTTGYQVAVTAPVLTFAPLPVRPFRFDDPAPPQGQIRTGYVVTVVATTPVVSLRITPAQFPTELLPVGHITPGYTVTAVTPPVVIDTGGGLMPQVARRPMYDPDEEAVLIALALL